MSQGLQPYCDDCLVSLRDLREGYLSRCREDGIFCLSLILGQVRLSPGHEVVVFMEKAGLLHIFKCYLLLLKKKKSIIIFITCLYGLFNFFLYSLY